MTDKIVIGIDVGTSSTKTIALDNKGVIVASFTESYPIYSPQFGWNEQDPEDWWIAAQKTIKQVLEQCKGASVEGISFSGQMHGMVALDKNKEVIRRAILWNDQRTQKQCDELVDLVGSKEKLIDYTNNVMLTGYTGGKILWMKENEPENYQKTDIILNPKDYIRFKLTGEYCTEVSDASGTGFFDVKNRCWSDELIEIAGLRRSLFPAFVESTEQTGVVNKEAAQSTGLKEGTKVFGGGGDAVISTTGMGLLDPGKIGISLGTSGVVAMGLPKFVRNNGGKLQVFCNNASGQWHAMGVTLAAAGSYQWFRDTFGVNLEAIAQEKNISVFDVLNEYAQNTPAGADGLIFLPYLNGERCPIFDSNAKGAFVGITASHKIGHFARAVLEGVSFSLKQVFDLIKDTAQISDAQDIIISGGGAKSELWRQILADIFNLPVQTVFGSKEGGAFGAALIASTGAGFFESLQDAMKLASTEEKTKPIQENIKVYQELYLKYIRLYESLKWFFN